MTGCVLLARHGLARGTVACCWATVREERDDGYNVAVTGVGEFVWRDGHDNRHGWRLASTRERAAHLASGGLPFSATVVGRRR